METGMNEAIEIGVDTLKIEGDPTKLYEALAKAQAEFAPVPKLDDGQVGNDRRFKYASYATVMKCVRPALAANGIAFLQPLHWRNGKAVTTTIIAGHGASIQTSFAFNADYIKMNKFNEKKDDCQEFGRAHTYYRRYQLQSILGIEGDDDADALPDPKERAQFSEKEERKLTAIAHERPEVASGASTPKGNGKAASAEPKSAPAEKPTSSSAAPSEPTTNGKAEVKTSGATVIPELDNNQLNALITSGMKQLGWRLIKLREFYGEHVDPEGFDTADNMPLDKKRELHAQMVKRHNVAPF
jgi:hypothetical protein